MYVEATLNAGLGRVAGARVAVARDRGLNSERTTFAFALMGAATYPAARVEHVQLVEEKNNPSTHRGEVDAGAISVSRGSGMRWTSASPSPRRIRAKPRSS